jgi:hypothetical protein
LATSVTVADGSSGSSTVTVTPSNGYTGTIAYTVSVNADLSNACYSLSDSTVSGTGAVAAAMAIYTSSSGCSSSSVTGVGRAKRKFVGGGTHSELRKSSGGEGGRLALAGLLFFGLFGVRSRKQFTRLLGGACVLAIVGLTTWGCGGSSSSSSTTTSSSEAAKGTYTLSITGADTSSDVSATTSMTLTID